MPAQRSRSISDPQQKFAPGRRGALAGWGKNGVSEMKHTQKRPARQSPIIIPKKRMGRPAEDRPSH